MKKLLIALVFVLTLTGAYWTWQTVRADIYGSSLVAWWTLDNGRNSLSAGGIKDSSGNGRDASAVGSPTFINGQVSQAMNVDGSTQYARMDTTPNWASTNWTISLWAKTSVLSTGYNGLFYCRSCTGAMGFGVGFGNNALTNTIGFNWSTGTEYAWDSGLQLPTTNQWTFVALVINSAGGTVYMGTKGQLKSATNAVTETSLTFDYTPDIGQDALGGRFFQGAVDDVRVYTRALSKADVMQLYYQGNSTHGGAGTF
jgi:hypothetical protein